MVLLDGNVFVHEIAHLLLVQRLEFIAVVQNGMLQLGFHLSLFSACGQSLVKPQSCMDEATMCKIEIHAAQFKGEEK